MKIIYKYAIPVEDNFSLTLPKGAKILTVQVQHDKPQLWALVDTDNLTENRTFCVIGTGHPIFKDNIEYIGTFQLYDGNFVGHVFEVIE